MNLTNVHSAFFSSIRHHGLLSPARAEEIGENVVSVSNYSERNKLFGVKLIPDHPGYPEHLCAQLYHGPHAILPVMAERREEQYTDFYRVSANIVQSRIQHTSLTLLNADKSRATRPPIPAWRF